MTLRAPDRGRWLIGWLVAGLGLAAIVALTTPPDAHAATCSDYATQADARRAADTADPDHDGRYCESLPCPCAAPSDTGEQAECSKPKRIVRLRFSAAEYRHVRRHFRGALRRGWPRTLVLNRRGADARRDRLLADIPTRDGQDRDEYPPAVGRGRGKGPRRGRHPRGWKADVRYVPSSENRSHGSSLGTQLRPFCEGTRFRYVFR